MYKISITLLVLIFSISLGHQAMATSEATKNDNNKNQVYHSIAIKAVEVKSSDLIENSLEAASSEYGVSWAWQESALNMLDSHTPFIFRTKKSADIDQLKVVLSINDRGKLVSFEVLSEEADKGLVERIAHVLRKLPNAMPVPGYTTYEATDFELIFSK